jgi:TetR/AcrR family transcriptional repressor of nem operon
MRRGEEARQEIIRRAAPIFNQKGYDAAALSDLMRATRLKKGGIYRHVESKQELAGDAFDYAWKLAMDRRLEGTEQIPNTVDRLKQIVRNFRDRRTGVVPGGCPLLNTAIDSDDGNPKLRAKARLPSVPGSTVCNQLPRRGSDGARSAPVWIVENWRR